MQTNEDQPDYEVSYVTPGIEKIHTNFILPEIKMDIEGWGSEGIYFIQDRDGFIKIGKSMHLPNRISKYKTHNAVMRLVGLIGCAPDKYLVYNENLLHRLWGDFVVTGEWFSPVRPLITYISAFDNGYGHPLELIDPEPNTYTELVEFQCRMKSAWEKSRAR